MKIKNEFIIFAHQQIGARHLLGIQGVPVGDELTLASTLARLIIIIFVIINIIIIFIISTFMSMIMIYQVVHGQWGCCCCQQILPPTDGEPPIFLQIILMGMVMILC